MISVAIALAAAAFLLVIFNTEPRSVRGGAVKRSTMPVEIIAPEFGRFRPRIRSTGTVEAARDIVLSSEVTGRVTAIGDTFVPGGFVKAGEVLVRLQKADFLNAIEQRRSELQNALSDLELERGRRDVARAEYERLGKTDPAESDALALRKPQIDAARQRVEAAKMALSNAKLDLRRSEIRAPFDAMILRRDVNIGSQVAPGQPLARLVGIDMYWVLVPVPLPKLRWLSIPDEAPAEREEAVPEVSSAVLRNSASWDERVTRTGKIARLIGAVDGDTRMARVVVTVPDPLSRAEGTSAPKLIVGEYLEVELIGKELSEGARLPRQYVRAGDTVWVHNKGKLEIRPVEVTMRDASHAYIAKGLQPGDEVVTSNLATVREGASLRVQAQPGREQVASDE